MLWRQLLPMRRDFEPRPSQGIVIEGRVPYLFVFVTLIQTIYPITASGSLPIFIAFQALYAGLIVSGILVLQHNPRMMWVLVITGTLWMIAGPLYALFPELAITQLAGYIAIGLYQMTVVKTLLQYVFRAKVVNADVLAAACTIYLLLGAIFVAVYGLVETITFTVLEDGHAFYDARADQSEHFPWQSFIYFSYTTLTTAGYGDVLPITMLARSLANLQSIIGVLYTTIIMARLVSLYSSEAAEAHAQ